MKRRYYIHDTWSGAIVNRHYDTEADAINEAVRLANMERNTFEVLEVVATVKTHVEEVVSIKVDRPESDDEKMPDVPDSTLTRGQAADLKAHQRADQEPVDPAEPRYCC